MDVPGFQTERYGRRRQPCSLRSLHRFGNSLVETQRTPRGGSALVAAGFAPLWLRYAAAHRRLSGATAPHQHPWLIYWDLRFDGSGLGAGLAASQLLSLLPAGFLRSAWHFVTADYVSAAHARGANR